jgi:NAD-dependent deacetylase
MPVHSSLNTEVVRARALLFRGARVVVLTGAGISAESGVPTFRGPGGLWKQFRPEDLATPEAFARDPRLVWEWYAWRRGLIAACAPNAAHRALAAWMARSDAAVLVTQNVDDLHERAAREAGAPDGPPRVLKVHGSIFRVRCLDCGAENAHDGPVDATSEATLPHCGCGGLLRPAVVWFGEMLPPDVIQAAFQAARNAEVCLVVGTAGAVYPAAGVVHEARRAGAPVIVVDPGATEYDDLADVRLVAAAGEVVPEVLKTGEETVDRRKGTGVR